MLSGGVVLICLVAAALAYLHDPPWVGVVTSGLGVWESEPSGARFRWTSSHATFYVPSDASAMTLPLKGLFGETASTRHRRRQRGRPVGGLARPTRHGFDAPARARVDGTTLSPHRRASRPYSRAAIWDGW